MMRKCLLAICALCLALCACSHKQYRSDLSCRELCDVAIEIANDGEEYAEHGESHLKYEFGDDARVADDICIVYSVKVEDISEIGVFFTEDAERVKDIAEDCKDYLEDMREGKSAFISSYAPEELPKLDNADVRIYGNYVIYAVLDKNAAENVFDEIEKRLTLQ